MAQRRVSEAKGNYVTVRGHYDGWGIVASFLCQVAWNQILDKYNNPVFNEPERKFAAELGHEITRIANSFRPA